MDEMIERVAKAIERACYDAAQEEGEYCTPAMAKAAARAAIEAMHIEQMVINAYVRGVEWNEENPLDRDYRFKAAGDYADAALSSSTRGE